MSVTLTGNEGSAAQTAEKVRLVVWDLDETFWTGTLTEGGITYRREVHATVLELARRGIMSSICSKNDFDRVRAVLEAEGLWDTFIFPSIDWSPKGARLAALVEAVQLRPPTILFIDDNPMNLREALHFVPGLQVADETIVGSLLDDPRLAGKDDRNLTRLAQYKLMERRRADEVVATAAVGSNHDFLRGSNIRVRIDYDVEAGIDRAVELINRTNQLNFTKSRLPEDTAAARAELRALLAQYDIQAGLIWVSDDYGDYGCCGLYVVRTRDAVPRVQHFCFSCRILNMGVEQWVYARLGRPGISVVGEVLGDLDNPAEIDWITPVTGPASQTETAVAVPLGRVVLRGGCDLSAIGHYFGVHARELVGEYNVLRRGMQIRNDHSLFLRHALDGLNPVAMSLGERLGYLPEDFGTRLFDPLPGNADAPSIAVLSFNIDAGVPVYRHRATGLKLPFMLPFQFPGGVRADARGVDDALVASCFEPQLVGAALSLLRAEFDYLGVSEQQDFVTDVGAALDAMPSGTRIFIIGCNEVWTPPGGRTMRHHEHVKVNAWLAEVAATRPRVEIVAIRDFVTDEAEVQSLTHFARPVYHRLYRRIIGAV